MAPTRTLARLTHLARRGVALATSADAAERRRVTARLTSLVRPLDTSGLDDLTAAYAKVAYQRGAAADLTALGLRTRSALVRRVIEVVAERTGSLAWQLALAEVCAGLPEKAAQARARGIFEQVVAQRGPAALGERQQLLYAQLLYFQGRFTELSALLGRLEALPLAQVIDLRADMLNPSHGRPTAAGADRESFWRSFTRPFRHAGLVEPTLLPEGDRPALDRLTTDPAVLQRLRDGLPDRMSRLGFDRLEDLPLISVVVAVYRPDHWLETAVRALIEQSYPNLDIVLVDDASGPEFAQAIAAVAALDPRIRVVSAPRNGGAYRARNLGVRSALGQIVTFHDADDWAHPEKVERQFAALWGQPEVVATESLAVRAHADLTHQWLGYASTRINKSSLMIRRTDLAGLGGFDVARKSGDQEFYERLTAVRGVTPTVVDLPLSVVRLRGDSLSRSDFAMGWAASTRIGHQSAYRKWHRGLRTSGQAVANLEAATDAGERPFAAPRGWLDQRDDERFDVLLVDDLAVKATAGETASLLRLLVDEGYTVAVMHREDPSLLRRPRPHNADPVQSLINAGIISQVHPEERIRAGVLIAPTPSVFVADREGPDDLACDLVLLLRQPEPRRGRVAVAWTVEAVADEVARWSDAPVVWAQTPDAHDTAGVAPIVAEQMTFLRA
ncbi:glycosyltransferase family A protein [Kribbia dieselivorans]|uniref:glycosyltransferase family A protein n=1 Tax=Kribbia dieselivorans TaxID=331526 RepID=UPI000837FC44|nr:glycosyltransferase family A protein [Kribbia dieselivorans]